MPERQSVTPIGEHRVQPLPDSNEHRLVCVRCSGEANSFDQYRDKPCRGGW